MKKFIVLVVMLCAVIMSSTASATTMPNWKLVKEETAAISPNPKYNLTPNQYYEQQYARALTKGLSRKDAKSVAGKQAREYQAGWNAELLKNMYSQPQKTSSFQIDQWNNEIFCNVGQSCFHDRRKSD